MTKNHALSAPDIGKMMGVSRVTALSWLKAGKIPSAKLANPGGKQRRFKNTPELRAWCKERKEMKAQQSARPRATRAERTSRRRLEKIDKLLEILKNQTEVSASDKTAALQYLRCLYEFWVRRPEQRDHSWPLPQIPLLEAIHAIYEGYLKFGYFPKRIKDLQDDLHVDIESAIERLPVCSEARPQIGQSSLNASD